MALQNFVAGGPPTIGATWLNAIDAFYTTLFASATTAAAARTAIGAAADAEVIHNILLTTLGDSIVASAADTPARLAANASVAAHATTMNPWVARTIVLTGGAVTFTDINDAPYAGANVWVKQNAAHIWTDGAVFDVQGNANFTAAAGDWLWIYATTVSTFEVFAFRAAVAPPTTGSFTATLTGCTTSPTITCTYKITNGVVTLFIPTVTATSNTTAMTLTGIPAAIRPTTAHTSIPIQATDNGSTLTTPAMAQVDTGGTITFVATWAGGAWTNSGTKGLPSNQSISYSLD